MSRFSIRLILVLFFVLVGSGFYFSLANFNEQRAPAVPVYAWRLEKEDSGVLRLEVLGENFKVDMPSLDVRCLLAKANNAARQLAKDTGPILTGLKERWEDWREK